MVVCQQEEYLTTLSRCLHLFLMVVEVTECETWKTRFILRKCVGVGGDDEGVCAGERGEKGSADESLGDRRATNSWWPPEQKACIPCVGPVSTALFLTHGRSDPYVLWDKCIHRICSHESKRSRQLFLNAPPHTLH